LYVGVSAGTIIACPDASIAAPFDDNRVGLKDMSALNVIDKVITPHYQHKEKAIIDKWEKDNSYTVIRLNDGQAVVVINNNIQVI
jgi:peptidase E